MVSIVEVTTKAQLRRFVEYPIELYKDVPQYIPGTYDDDLQDWDRKKNPAFEYCQARCWLAMRDGEIVGRIGAILSRKANEKWHTNRLRFTQVDFIDDYQVSKALFDTVEDWGRQTMPIVLLFCVYDTGTSRQGYRDLLSIKEKVMAAALKNSRVDPCEILLPIDWNTDDGQYREFRYGTVDFMVEAPTITAKESDLT